MFEGQHSLLYDMLGLLGIHLGSTPDSISVLLSNLVENFFAYVAELGRVGKEAGVREWQPEEQLWQHLK